MAFDDERKASIAVCPSVQKALTILQIGFPLAAIRIADTTKVRIFKELKPAGSQ